MSTTRLFDDEEEQIEAEPVAPSNLPPRPTTGTDGSGTTARPASSRMPRKPTQVWFEIWNHFTKFSNDQSQIRAACNYCKKDLATDPKANGTSSLNNHFKRCKSVPKELRTGGGESSGGIQIELVLGFEGDGSLSTWKFSQEAVRKSVAEMLITDEVPFRFVESKGFKKCMATVCPRFHMPSRWTIARDCYKLYCDQKVELKKSLLRQTSRMCLTTDSWTSVKRDNFMCLTAHYVDNNWKLTKRILNFCPIDSHKGEDIGKAVEKCCREWGIDRVFTVTVDNASSNDVVLQWLKKRFTIMGTSILEGKYMHMRCLAHIVNLVVSDGLKEFNELVARVRGAIKYVRASPSRLSKFKICVADVKIQCKALLCMDVCTRWNSTYLMLKAAEKFERAFQAFGVVDSNYSDELMREDGVPLSTDWDVCRKFVHFLEQYYILTTKVSGSKYITYNCFLDHISTMCKTLKEWEYSEDEHFCRMAKRMMQKFNKYWGDLAKVNMCVYFAIVLDPTKKVTYLEWLIEMMCSKEETAVLMIQIQDALLEFFGEYKKTFSEEVGESSQAKKRGTEKGLQPKVTSLKSTFKKQKVDCPEETESELVTYLNEKRVDDDSEDYDVLLWWKLNHLRFPILSQTARNVLAVPISTVASESAFSTGGRILDEYRSSLTPKVVRALICSQDWDRSPIDNSVVLDVASPCVFEPESDIEQLEDFDSDLKTIALDPVEDF